jgi:hypothetical protein
MHWGTYAWSVLCTFALMMHYTKRGQIYFFKRPYAVARTSLFGFGRADVPPGFAEHQGDVSHVSQTGYREQLESDEEIAVVD